MREIILDTETTGIDNEARVVEIGCVEMVDLIPTGRTFHVYINPQMKVMPSAAYKVHGLSIDFLKSKPTFKRIVNSFLRFVGRDTIVAHNASFDVRMLNLELERLDMVPLANPVEDTLILARAAFPGRKISLDSLISKYGIKTKRDLHGALLDAQILSEIYVELRGGRQLGFDLPVIEKAVEIETVRYGERRHRSRITPAEQAAHDAMVAGLGATSIWASYLQPALEEAA